MQGKKSLWLVTSYLLFFLLSTCACFLQSSQLSCERRRQNGAILIFHDVHQLSFDFQHVAHHGITSILSEETSGTIVVGTKSGEVFLSKDNAATWTELSGYDHKPKYPVYSLAVETVKDSEGKKPKLARIFSGRGDRYISVWNTETKKYEQRLGPHTGWVQDLGYDEESKILYSIGCNCIELWDCSGRETSDGSIRQMCKLSVENSVLASTLSSDLLRLCLVDRQHLKTVREIGKGTGGEKHLLLSGGVDGRIHAWSIYRQATLVHEGRINAMTYSSKNQILFSVGNDGKLCASRINSETMAVEVVSKLELRGSPRLTTITMVEEGDNLELLLAVGTTDGDLIYATATVNSSDSSITMAEGETTTIKVGSKIYAVIPLQKEASLESESKAGSQDQHTRILLVGHGKGMVKQIYRLTI